MSHEHFHCFVDMLLARPVHLDEMGGAIEGSVAEVKRLQDVNADMFEALRAVRQELWVDYCLRANSSQPDPEQFNSRPHIRIIDAAIAKAEGKS